jgi:hypothetical protein
VSFEIVPITLAAAKQFVTCHHRHNKAPTGHKFSVGLLFNGGLVGVGVAGRPVSRHLDDGLTIEVSRTCTMGDRNANSKIYGAVLRCAKAMGYKRAITYTQQDESGASLRAVGFTSVSNLPPRKNWANSSVKGASKRDATLEENVARIRWEKAL